MSGKQLGISVLCILASLLAHAHSRLFPCVYQDNQLWIVDAYTNEEVRECVSTILIPNDYVELRKLYIHCPVLTELKTGVLSGLRVTELEIIAPKLEWIGYDILDGNDLGVRHYLQIVTVSSEELLELNEAQWAGFYNFWSLKIIGTKLTSMSFAFALGSNMRELYIHNATYLTTIDRNEADIMGTYVFESTGISELPQRMFEKNVVTSQRVTFKKNWNLRVLKQGVFQGGSMGLYIDFVDSPIEHIEPNFIDFKQDGLVQIQLGGNRIGKIERTVFEPLFQIWNNNPRDNFIKWDVDGDQTSAPVQCDCNVNWLLSNPNYLKWVKNAVCTTGQPLDQLSPFGSDVCFECPGYSGLYPNPTDCTTFYQCANYEAHLMTCPDGLVFNSATNICDWRYNTQPPCGTAVGE